MTGADTFHAAAAYDRAIGRYGASLGAALVEFADLRPGLRALDVGCGTGMLTSVLAGLLGAGNVAGAEPSEPFAAACRARVPGAEIVVAPAEALPFPDDGFDAALSQLVLNFLADVPVGVRELARVTRPGGTVASCVWDYAGEMTLLRAFWDAAREVEPVRGAAADEGVVMRWSSEPELRALWEEAGLADVRTGALTAWAAYESFDDLWAPFPSGIAPSGAFAASLDEERQAALRDALRRRLGAGESPFELTARAWAVRGTVP